MSGASKPAPRILIVEDEAIAALDLQRILQSLGYAVAGWVTTGEQSLTECERLAPDLILMDIQLDGAIDGIEAARIIRQRHGIPVILLTAFADTQTLERAKDVQPFAYLLKPFQEETIRTNIEVTLARHRMEQKLNNLVQRSHDGIVMTDTLGIVKEWNAAAETITMIRAEEAVGRPLAALLLRLGASAPDGSALSEEVLQAWFAAMLADRNAADYARLRHFCIHTPKGERRHLQASMFPVDTEDGIGIGSIFRDITVEQQITERRMRLALEQEKLRMLTEYIGAVSHELRTPLTVVSSAAFLIEREAGDIGRVPERLALIRKQVRAMTELMDQISVMANLEYETTDSTSIVAINDLANQLHMAFANRAQEQGLTLALDLAEDLPLIHADAARLRLACQHILQNAFENTPRGGRVTLRTRPAPAGVALDIEDTGSGIPSDAIPHIFEPFFRVDSARTTRKAGLGLAIAHQIISAHNGNISVKSTVGQGSCFCITLPVNATLAPSPDRQDTPSP
ncbi:MAG: histidine kinase dimerization/phosphoacceptor domain -containing protein [Anaerolineae bacterium]